MSQAPTARIVALLLALLALGAAACGGSDRPTSDSVGSVAEAAARGPAGVGVVTLTLTDSSRPTAPNRDYAGAPDRTLVLEVWYPSAAGASLEEVRDAPLETEGAPYPLVVISHGFSANRRLYTSYGAHLASHGFVVAAPDFPLTHLGAPGGPRFGDLVNQPADVSFIIDSLLELSESGDPPLRGAIDGEHIGTTGHSLGGATTLLTMYGPLADERVDAALPIAPAGCPGETFFSQTPRPMLVMEGQRDLFVGNAPLAIYDRAPAPKYLVSVVGGEHIPFADTDLSDQVGLQALGRSRAERLEGISADAGSIQERTGLSLAGCSAGLPERPVVGDGESGATLLEGSRQRELLDLYATLFFSATLRDDEAALAALQGESDPPPPEVELQFEEP